MRYSSAVLAALAASVAAKDGRTFAVLRFYGDGPLMEGRVDPIVSPGVTSAHVHTIMGGSNIGISATGESMMESNCSNALVVGDNSGYWVPKVMFHDKAAGTFEPVEMFYMNVYYFFEGTNDEIKAFPVGLQMVSGNAMTRECANASGGELVLDPSQGNIQPTQWTCPRSNFSPQSWPAGSDGSTAGIQDPNNQGSGMGFPFAECDGYAAPLRMDLHFPSCYNPAAGLTNYQENMAFPTNTGTNKQDCPEGWIHTPHLFYEMYWNTPKFIDRWTPNSGEQPFVLANGDLTGCSAHGDFLAAWDEPTLQNVIDTCNTGDGGMDTCAGVQVRDNSKTCNVPSPIKESLAGVMDALPGNNPLAGWGVGDVTSGNTGGTSAAAPVASSAVSPLSTAPANDDSSNPATTTAEVPSPTKIVTEPLTTMAPDSSSTTSTTAYTTMTTVVTPSASASASSSPSTGGAAEIAGFKYAGCFKDTSARVIQGIKFPSLGGTTNEKCITYCTAQGYTLTGTENGGQCFCGNDLDGSEALDESSCSMACEGDSSDICGGGWALSVYSVNGSATLVKKREEEGAIKHLFRHRSYGRVR